MAAHASSNPQFASVNTVTVRRSWDPSRRAREAGSRTSAAHTRHARTMAIRGSLPPVASVRTQASGAHRIASGQPATAASIRPRSSSVGSQASRAAQSSRQRAWLGRSPSSASGSGMAEAWFTAIGNVMNTVEVCSDHHGVTAFYGIEAKGASATR